MNSKKLLWIIIGLIGLALVCTLPFVTTKYMLRVYNMTLITYICVLSIFIVFGMCGQMSFAQAGFWGIGAYIAAMATTKAGLSPIVALIVSILGTALAALIVGVILFRLKGHYFGFSTIGIVMILNGIFSNWKAIGGADGIAGIPSFGIGSFVVNTEKGNFFLILVFAIVISIITEMIRRSSLGRSFMAIRDNEIAANCMGVNSFATKNIAFVIGAMYCGLAGALFAFLGGYISGTTFTFTQSSLYLVMLMVGGFTSTAGPAIGSTLLMLLPEWFRPLQNYIMLIYGVGVMVLMVVLPDGLVGGGKRFYEKFITSKQRNAMPR